MAQTHQSHTLAEDLDLGVILNKGKVLLLDMEQVPLCLVLWRFREREEKHGPVWLRRMGKPTPPGLGCLMKL